MGKQNKIGFGSCFLYFFSQDQMQMFKMNYFKTFDIRPNFEPERKYARIL